MNSDALIKSIDQEISRLQEVRKLLVKSGNSVARKASSTSARKTAKPVKRVLSPEARQRIADAQKKRWAAAKRANK